MITEFCLKLPIIKTAFQQFNHARIQAIFQEIQPFIKKDQKIMDLGSGICYLTKVLQDQGYSVTPVDVRNLSTFREIHPIIYDGEHLPFQDKSFDVILLITVLHHTKNPLQVLQEAKRVAKEVIVIEDIYENNQQKYLTYLMDSTLNLEFFNHPHSNKDDIEWKQTFGQLGFKLVKAQYHSFWKFFLSATYYLRT